MKNDKNNATESTRPVGFQDVPKRRYDDIETLEIDAVELFPETYDCGVIAISAYETAIGDGEDDDTDDPEDKLLFRIRVLSSENKEDATIDLSQEELKQLIDGLGIVLAYYGYEESGGDLPTEEEREEIYKRITNPPFDSLAQKAFEDKILAERNKLEEKAEKTRLAWAEMSLDDFEAVISSAWTTAHHLVEEAERTGRTDRLLEIVRGHWQEVEALNNAVQAFYEFSGSDADTWESWTEPIAEAADELLDRIGAEFHEHH